MKDTLISSLELDKSEFLFQFQSHPNYPSALAFSDTLNFLDLKNDAYELEKEYWQELPEEFITLYKNNFSLIRKYGQNYQVISDDVQTIDYKTLVENSQDFVMLIHKTEKKIEKKTIEYSKFLYLLFALIISFSFWQFYWMYVAFNMFSLAGVYISLELFQEKFGKESVVLTQFCNGTKDVSVSNCNKVIESDKLNFYGLKLADLSLIYFVCTSVLGLFFFQTEFLLKLLTFSSIVVICYSGYIQIFIEKVFCKVCALIILILICQLIISSFYFTLNFSGNTLFLSFLLFSIIILFVVFISDNLKEKNDFRKANIKNIRFKRNYDLFKRELFIDDKITFENNTNGFFIGKENAKLHITLISNPYCGFCKEAHEILENLLKIYPNDISLQIRFNYDNDPINKEYTILLQKLKGIYVQDSQIFLDALHFWFESKDYKTLSYKFPNFENTDLKEMEKITVENYEKEFTFTPIIILNGYKFPNAYDREDIHYFIEDLLEDEEIINEN